MMSIWTSRNLHQSDSKLNLTNWSFLTPVFPHAPLVVFTPFNVFLAHKAKSCSWLYLILLFLPWVIGFVFTLVLVLRHVHDIENDPKTGTIFVILTQSNSEIALFLFQTGLYWPLCSVFLYKKSLLPVGRDFTSTSPNGGILLIHWSSWPLWRLMLYGSQPCGTQGINGSLKTLHSSLQTSSFQAPSLCLSFTWHISSRLVIK